MSKITAGAVVDAATTRGLYPVIIASVDGETFTGYTVSPREHYVVIDRHSGILDEVISEHPERAAVIEASGDAGGGAVVFKDEDGIRVYSIGHERRGTSVRDVSSALVAARRILSEIGETEQADSIQRQASVYAPYLSGLLNED